MNGPIGGWNDGAQVPIAGPERVAERLNRSDPLLALGTRYFSYRGVIFSISFMPIHLLVDHMKVTYRAMVPYMALYKLRYVNINPSDLVKLEVDH